jgi:hypothetical protein
MNSYTKVTNKQNNKVLTLATLSSSFILCSLMSLTCVARSRLKLWTRSLFANSCKVLLSSNFTSLRNENRHFSILQTPTIFCHSNYTSQQNRSYLFLLVLKQMPRKCVSDMQAYYETSTGTHKKIEVFDSSAILSSPCHSDSFHVLEIWQSTVAHFFCPFKY